MNPLARVVSVMALALAVVVVAVVLLTGGLVGAVALLVWGPDPLRVAGVAAWGTAVSWMARSAS